ncbi:hypothetical protein DEMA109039_10120 [Deinococcus marmoris]
MTAPCCLRLASLTHTQIRVLGGETPESGSHLKPPRSRALNALKPLPGPLAGPPHWSLLLQLP